jgi:hypothetical protein
MSTLTTQGGKLLLRQNKLGTQQACCCQPSCCGCGTGEGDVFVSESCGLNSIVLAFDFSELGACTGNFTVELTADDQDKGFPWSKNVTVNTAGGTVNIEANMFCVANCIVLQFSVLPVGCDFCENGAAFFGGLIEVAGVTDESGVCCPVGGSVTYGPNIDLCENESVQFTVQATFVY